MGDAYYKTGGDVNDDDDTIHVLPENDLIEHDTDGEDCPCGPVTEPVEREDGSMGWLVVHNALDGREHDEEDHDRANCPICQHRKEE